MRLFKTFREGWRYHKRWPNHAIVGGLPEAQVVPLTKLISWMLPVAALLNFVVQWTWLGSDYLGTTVTASLFLLLLPLQAYYWLGKRSLSELPLSLRAWYFDLQAKLHQAGKDVRLPSHRPGPCYCDLADIVNKALAELPSDDY